MRERPLATSIMVLAVVCGVVSLALFVGLLAGLYAPEPTRWPLSGLLAWDGLLSLAFFLQHSLMVRGTFRAGIAGVIPPRYHRALYCIASGIVLAGVVLLWRRSEDHLLVLEGPLRWAAQAVGLMGILVFLWGGATLRNLDLFGLNSIKAHLRGTTEPLPVFVVRGPYRWVRHPFYLGAILLFWSCPDLTADRLLFNVLWTGWVCIGARLEEADILREFGPAYDKYRERVPMFIPYRRPA